MFKTCLRTSTFVGKSQFEKVRGCRNRPKFPDSDLWAISTPGIGMKMCVLLEQHLCYLMQTFEHIATARQAR